MSHKEKNPSKFTNEQIDKLIQFVKTHKVLYVNARDIRNRSLRENLWNELARSVNKSPELCKKKFKDLRDRFVRNLKRTQPNRFKSYFKKMIFLLEIHPELQAKAERANTMRDMDDSSNCNNANSVDDYSGHSDGIDFVDVPSVESSETNNDNNEMPTSDIFDVKPIDHRRRVHSSKTMMYDATQSLDVLDKLLLGLGATIRTFPEIEIVKLKLELSTIVFNKEMELAADRAKKKDCSNDTCKCTCRAIE